MSIQRFRAQHAAVLLIMLSVLWIGKDLCMAEKRKPAPNILFILTDDQRLEDIQHMPKLNKLLVNEGMSFQNYFSSVSLCCPSRTSILRGQYAHNTGVLTNGSGNGGFEVAHARGLENSTIATWMHDQGYSTALIGKYLNHYPGQLGSAYVPPGWDYWASAVAGNPYGQYNYTLNENGKSVEYGSTPADYGTDVYLKKATEFIKGCTAKEKPFFLYLAFYAPHAPATPAPRHLDMFPDAQVKRSKAFNEADVSNKPAFIQNLPLLTAQQINSADAHYAKRLRSVQAVDEAIEKLYNTLSDAKQLDNTYIFFVSDNGFHLGEHRMQRGKQTAYETDIHLPLIVRGPGITHGAKAEELAGNIDLAPTWTDLAGATAPKFVDGRSLKPILQGQHGSSLNWREVFLIEHWQAGRAAREDNSSTTPEVRNTTAPEASNTTSSEIISTTGNEITALQEEPDAYQELVSDADSVKVKAIQKPEPASEDAANSEARGKGGRKHRRRGKQGELSAIPEFHALRAPQSSYVEYVTGEREFYKLAADPDQVNNLAAAEAANLKTYAACVGALKKGAASQERELESQGAK